MTDTFTALVIDKDGTRGDGGGEGKISSQIKQLSDSDLPSYEAGTDAVTVAIEFSGVNYKDGLVMKGLGQFG